MLLTDIFDPEPLQKVHRLSDELMNSSAASFHGRSCNSHEPAVKEHTYKTVQASKWPCGCKYNYRGADKHHVFQYARPQIDGYEPNAADAAQLPKLTELMEVIQAGLRNRMMWGTSRAMGGTKAPTGGLDLPDFVVMNRYQHPRTMMGEHHDGDHWNTTRESCAQRDHVQ
jgi:hypothetical protein